MNPDEITRYREKLYRVALSMLKNHDRAQDAVQETYVRALSGNEFAERSQVYTWMHRIAINVCIDMMRKGRRSPECATEDLSDFTSHERLPDEAIERMERLQLLDRALQKIRPELREFLLEDMVRERSRSGSRPSTVRGRIVRTRRRAMEAVRKEMVWLT